MRVESPAIDSELPRRAKVRTEMALPRLIMSKTEVPSHPSLLKRRMEIDEPNDAYCITLSDLPVRIRLRSESEEPQAANPRIDMVVPVCCIKFVEKLSCNASDSMDLLVRLSKSMQHSTLQRSFKARKAHLWTLQTFHKRELA